MGRILIVEDDEYFRAAVVSYLREKNHEVLEAPNGRVARDILGAHNVDLVISDMQMPFLNGIELFEWIKSLVISNRPKFVLMTGFSHLIETQTAFDMGVDNFLAKPFKNEELAKVVSQILTEKPKQSGPEDVRESPLFCRVSIEEFVAKPRIDFDVYVCLSADKYVKIGRAGDLIPTDRIEHYKSKGLKHLHIRREDYGKLVQFNLQVSKALQGKKDLSSEKKANFIRYTGEVVLEKAFVAGVDQETFDEARQYLGLTVNMISEEDSYFDLLGLLNDHSDHIYAHSLGVSMYSIMIARTMGFESQQVFFKLSMAGMFHDIGKKEIDPQILSKSRPLLSQTERRLIETHCLRGKEILLAVKGIPSDVIQLVYEHHEDIQGQGYPRGIGKNQQHPLSRILQLANLFVENALKSPHNEGRTAKATIEYIESVYLDRIDPEALRALRRLFKL